MLSLRIPKSDYDALRFFADADLDALRNVCVVLRESPSLLGGDRLRQQVALAFEPHLTPEEAQRFAQLLVSLTSVRRRHGVSAGELVDSLELAVQKQADIRLDTDAFRERKLVLTELIELQALDLVVKTYELIMGHANIYANARVITDVRPVFDDDATAPLLGVISHTLRLTLVPDGEDEGQRTVSVYLDESDLRELADEIDRALKKAGAIREKLSPSMQLGVYTPGGDQEDKAQ